MPENKFVVRWFVLLTFVLNWPELIIFCFSLAACLKIINFICKKNKVENIQIKRSKRSNIYGWAKEEKSICRGLFSKKVNKSWYITFTQEGRGHLSVNYIDIKSFEIHISY